MAVNYTMQPVIGLPARKSRSSVPAAEKRYYPLFQQMLEAYEAGFFANPDHYIEVARYGGGGTASSTKKAILKGDSPVPPAPEGCKWTLVPRRIELEDAEGNVCKSVLYARIDTLSTEGDDADVDADDENDGETFSVDGE